jgi:hypothetical protein
MFAKMIDNPQKVDNLKKPQKGKVVYNLDPLKLGRIKCYVRGIYEDSDHTKLPWAFPKNPTGLGGKPDCSSFCVPEIDSEVTIVFPFGDENTPFYDGYWQSKLTTQSSLFSKDYPNTYGWVDSVIEWFRINKIEPSLEFFRSTLGDLIRIDKDGNLLINVPASLIINVGDSFRVKGGVSSFSVSQSNISVVSNVSNRVASVFNDYSDSGTSDRGPGDEEASNTGQAVQPILDHIQALQDEVTALKALVEQNRPKIAK